MGQARIPQWVKTAFNRSSGNILAQWLSGNSILAGLLAKDRRLSRASHWLSLRVSWSKRAEGRGRRALEILADEGSISKVSPHHYTIRSQSDSSKMYNVRYKVPPARTGDDPNNSDIGHNPTQTEDVQAIEIRFRSIFCKVLPETGRYGWQKSILHQYVERMRSIMQLMRLSESASATYQFHVCLCQRPRRVSCRLCRRVA